LLITLTTEWVAKIRAELTNRIGKTLAPVSVPPLVGRVTNSRESLGHLVTDAGPAVANLVFV
jgi:hypothetical protein